MTLSKFSYLPSFPNHFFFSIEPGIENSHNRFLTAIRFLLIEHVEEVVVNRSFTGKGGGRSPKFLSALLASVWSKNKGGGGGRPPRPLCWIRLCGNKMTFLIPLLRHGPFLKIIIWNWRGSLCG